MKKSGHGLLGYNQVYSKHRSPFLQQKTKLLSSRRFIPPKPFSEHLRQDVTEMTMQALQASREQMAPLNMDGVCLFRLTRMAKTEHVQQLLLNPDGPLAALHARVLEAGCEVNPDWSPVKVLFVPITEAQMNELQDLADFGFLVLFCSMFCA